MHVSRVQAKNFRCLRDIDIELRPFTILLGPNGVGKSSLLQLLQLFRGIRKEGSLGESFARLGGFHANLSSFDNCKDMTLGVGVEDDIHRFNYSITLVSQPGGFFVHAQEASMGDLNAPPRITWRQKAGSLESFTFQGLAHIPTDAEALERASEPEKLWEYLDRSRLWKGHLFQPDGAVRTPQRLQPTHSPANDGTDLVSAIYNLKTSRKEKYQELREILKLAIPEFEELDFPIAGTGYFQLAWKQANLVRPLDASQLSDGTLRFLWLLTALLYVPDESIVMIDEPELSLHPQWSQLMVSVLRDASARCQVIVATQSTEFVRWAEPDEILIADTSETGAQFSWADAHPNLAKWLKDFSLEEMWSMGELGGRR